MGLVTSLLQIVFTYTESNTFGGVTVPNEGFVHQTASSTAGLTNGTGTGQGNHGVELTGNATTGGVSIDLTATGASTGLDGKNRDFSNGGSGGNVKDFLFENLDTVNSITISQPASNGWTGLSGAATGLNLVVGPGDCVAFRSNAGKAVSATNKLLTLTASAGTPAYKLSMDGVAA